MAFVDVFAHSPSISDAASGGELDPKRLKKEDSMQILLVAPLLVWVFHAIFGFPLWFIVLVFIYMFCSREGGRGG